MRRFAQRLPIVLVACAGMLSACATSPVGFVDPGRGARPLEEGQTRVGLFAAGAYGNHNTAAVGGNIRAEYQMQKNLAVGVDLMAAEASLRGADENSTADDNGLFDTNLQVIAHYNPGEDNFAIRGGVGTGLLWLTPGGEGLEFNDDTEMNMAFNGHIGGVYTLGQMEMLEPFVGVDVGAAWTLPFNWGLYGTPQAGMAWHVNEMMDITAGAGVMVPLTNTAFLPLNGAEWEAIPYGDLSLALKF
jgi:hypothetical protein